MSDEQAGDKKPRGRPRSGTAMSGAERQAAYRNRRRQSFIRLELDHGDWGLGSNGTKNQRKRGR